MFNYYNLCWYNVCTWLLVQHELKFQKGEIDASFTIIYKLKLFIPFYSYNVHITVGSSGGDR